MDILKAFAENQNKDYSDIILCGAFKYALLFRDGKTAEAVIMTLESSIGTLGDEMLKEMQEAIERYLKDGFLFAPEAKFAPEWTKVLEWIEEERGKRAEGSHEG